MSFIKHVKSSNARWPHYFVHFTFYSFRSNARSPRKKCDRRVFLTCPSIANTNRIRDYILGGQRQQQFRGVNRGHCGFDCGYECCQHQHFHFHIKWQEFTLYKTNNDFFLHSCNRTPLPRLMELSIFYRMKIFVLLHS